MSQPRGPKRPPIDQVKWQLQVEGGRTVGPLTTQDLLLRISEGILSGDEKIRQLPDGQWNPVSREPVFYDKLLEALDEDLDKTQFRPSTESKTKSVVLQPKDQPSEPPPSNYAFDQEPLPAAKHNPLVPLTEDEQQVPSSLPATTMQKLNLSTDVKANVPSPVLPKINSIPPPVEAERKSGFLKILILAVIAIVGYFGYVYIMDKKSGDNYQGLRIKTPRPTTKSVLTPEQQNKALGDIYKLLFLDSVGAYDQAQTRLISLIEKSPILTEPRGLLCLVQLHLWPYVRQDATDLENLKITKTAGSRMDPVGLAGIHCEVTFLMIMGKYQDAMGLIENTSNRREIAEESPVLYSTKAEILASEKNYPEAIGWAQSAAKLWPQWARPYYQMGIYNFEISATDKAAENFEKVLYLNPMHREALIEYGVLIYLGLKDVTRAEKFLAAALKVQDPISKIQESKMYYYLAKILGGKNQNQKALEFATKSYQLNPGDLKARDYLIQLGGSPGNIMRQNQHNELVFLGDQYARAGDFLAAQAEYKAAFEIDQKNAMAAMKAAKALWSLYQAEEAMKWLGKAISADPKFSMPYFLMADYYSQLYNFQGAGEALARGSQKLGSNADILRGYGLVELRRNNHKQAIIYLEKALKITEDVDTLTLLAKAYSTAKLGADPEKAMAYATKAIQLEDANPEAQIAYAKVLALRAGVPSAVSYMKERIQKYSYTPEYILGLAEIYQEAERYKEAQAEYEKIFLLDNKNKRALMGLGSCFQAQLILDRALKMFLAAAVQDPSDPEPVFKAGLVYMDGGRFKEAQAQFERGVNINKVYPKGYYLLGRAALKQKNYNMALQAANEEKKNNPSLADAYILAGDIYREMNEFAKCGAEFQSAVRLRPKGADNYVKMAQCQMWAGNLEIAENMLAIAKDQESGFADIYKLQGAIFEKKMEVQEACLAYQNYLSLSPNATDRKDIEGKISNLCGGR